MVRKTDEEIKQEQQQAEPEQKVVYIEREISLSTINDKLNYLIELLSKK